MIFKHFIITRFNLKHTSKNWQRDKQGNEVLTDEWMNARMEIFLRYCVPSVVNQDNKNFTWLIYIDKDTKEEYKKQFRELTFSYPFIIVREAKDYDDFQNNYCSDIIKLMAKKCQYIITTRLDNDDILHRKFISKIQSQFSNQNYLAVNFSKIFMLHPLKRNKLHIDYQFSNHFISLIEKVTNEGIKGCYSKKDRFWNVTGKIVQIPGGPYCTEIISNGNLYNDFRGFPVLIKKPFHDFSLTGKFGNSIVDIDNLKLWKMSWIKLAKHLKLQLMETKRT